MRSNWLRKAKGRQSLRKDGIAASAFSRDKLSTEC